MRESIQYMNLRESGGGKVSSMNRRESRGGKVSSI